MNEKTRSFTNTPELDKPPSSLIKVIYAEAKGDSSSGSSGSIASEDNLQQVPNNFTLKGNLDVVTSGSRNALSQKDRGRTSIMPGIQDGSDNTASNKPSWLHPDQTEKGSSQTSNLSLGFLPVSPMMSKNASAMSSNLPRRPSRFYTVIDDKESSNFSSAVVKERRMSPAHISKSQEFLQVSPQIELDTDHEPATATLVKKPRPSVLSGFKLLNSNKNDSRDSIKPLKATQMSLIDDKVALSSRENRHKGSLVPPSLERKSTRKSKLLDRISLIAAKSDADDSKLDSPALIFKQVLKKVNPISLQKAEKKIRRRYLITIQNKILKLARAPFQVFSPEDTFTLLRNLLTPVIITIDTFLAPFMISFYPEGRYDTFIELGATITIFFILDLFVNFRTAFYDKGLLITDSKEITKHYFKKSFATDFVVILTDVLSLFYYDTFLWYTKFASLIRLKKLWNIITGLEDYLIMSRTWNALLKLLKLWGGILIVAHWLACIFQMIAYETEGQERTWLDRIGLQNSPVQDRYIAAFFWSITTMVTVGYGDIVPVSNIERVYVVIAMILSSALFGYTLNTVGEIIREMSYEKDQKREKNRSVRKYMNQKNLGKNIQTRVKNYLQYMIESRMLYKQDDEEFFSLLSQNLKDEIVSEVNGKILAESKLFSINFTAKATSRLATYMKEIFKSPEEVIFEEGDDSDHSIYFIVYGKVQVAYKAKNVKVLEKGANFGDVSFFSGQARNASAKSLFFTNMYSLNRETAIEKLRGLPSDFEMFHFIKDSINLYKDYSHLQIQCYSCDQKGHLAKDCPEIHFNADREEIIKNYINRQAILKKKFPRNLRPRFHVRQNLASLESLAKMIQEDYNDYTVSDEELSQDSLDIILERNLILIPGGEMNDMKNRKMERKRKSARASINLVYEQVANANDIIGRRTSQLMSQNLIGEKRESVYDPMSLKGATGEHIFFSIDKVENFELYFPQNNVIKLITEFDKIMFEQLLESRGGVAKALVIRNFGSMLRSNKGPHKSPLFYANLKKETIIQRGRKKLETPEVKPQPIQRLGTLMKTVLNDKKKQNRAAARNSKMKIFVEDQIELSFEKSKSSIDEEESEYKNVLVKASTLENDEATIPRSDRMYEKKQTNPSLFMGKLNSLNPKMINNTQSDGHKWTSRTSSIDSPFPKSTPKVVEESKDKSGDVSKDKSLSKRDRLIHLFAENRVTEENDDAKSSQRNSKHRKSSRCSSQGKLDEIQKLVNKLDVENGLVQRMFERSLSKRQTAYFGF